MTGQVDIERLLDGWFVEGPAAMPGGFMGSVADAIAQQPQRVVWRVRGNRVSGRSFGAFVMAAAALALVAVIGFNLIPKLPAVNSSPSPSAVPASPSPSPTVTPTPTRAPLASATSEPSDPPDGSPDPTPPPLAAGTYVSENFKPYVTFTVPQGWFAPYDERSVLSLGSISGNAGIGLWWDVYPMQDVKMCHFAYNDPQSPHAAADFVDYMQSRPDWTGTREPLTLGGLHGWHVEGELRDGGCEAAYYVHNYITTGPGPGPWAFDVLDDGKGSTIMIQIEGDPQSAAAAAAEAVRQTFVFNDVRPEPPRAEPCATEQPGSTPPTPTIEQGFQLEPAFWQDADGGYRYVVVATNTSVPASLQIHVTLFDSCGASFDEWRTIPSVSGQDRWFSVDRDESVVVIGDVEEHFVPVRMEIRGFSLNDGRVPNPTPGACSRLADGHDAQGKPTVRGLFSTSFRTLHVFGSAFAVYRNEKREILGADAGEFGLRSFDGQTSTTFEIERSMELPASVSADLVCRVTYAGG